MFIYFAVYRQPDGVGTRHHPGRGGRGGRVAVGGRDGERHRAGQRRVVQVPQEAVRPGCAREDLLRAGPVVRHVDGGHRVGFVGGGVAAHQFAAGVQDVERDESGGFFLQGVINDGPVGRVLSGGFLLRQRGVGVHVPADAVGALGPEERHRGFGYFGGELAQRRDVVQNPEAAPVGADHEVVVLDDQVADGGGGHIEPQRLPVVPVVERHGHRRFRPGEEQTLPQRVFPYGVDGLVGQAACDFLPGGPAVAGAQDVGFHVVEPVAVDGGIHHVGIGVAGVQLRHLGPGFQAGRRHVPPVFTAVAGDVDEAVVGPGPNREAVHVGGSHGVDDSPAGHLFHFFGGINAHAGRNFVVALAAEVGADHFPGIAAGLGFKQYIPGKKERFGINGRKQHRGRADESVLPAANGLGGNVLRLPGALVEAGDLAPIHDVRVERVGGYVSVFLHAHGMPLAVGDLAVVAPAGDAHRAAFLLSAQHVVGKGVVGADVVKLRRGLVVPRAEGLPAVDGDDRALVARQQDDVGIGGVESGYGVISR